MSNPIGWQLSGFKVIAHWIEIDGRWLRAVCGVIWWDSDSVTSIQNPMKADTPKCKRCLRNKQVPRV